MSLFVGGCLFAPSTCGSRGLRLPENENFLPYVEECRSMSSEFDSCCRQWGTPVAARVGSSGGYFVWKERPVMVTVGSFGRTRVLNSIPKDLTPFVFPGAVVVRAGDVRMRTDRSRAHVPLDATYSVERFERVLGNDLAYDFVLSLSSSTSVSQASRIKDEIRAEVIADYKAAHTGERFESIGVDFPKFTMSGGRIEGRAEVMQMRVMSLAYDQSTRKGVIVVKIGAARFDQARRWVRENIELLARDKNVALMTGELPSAGKFYLGAERVKDGNVLEIEFETE